MYLKALMITTNDQPLPLGTWRCPELGTGHREGHGASDKGPRGVQSARNIVSTFLGSVFKINSHGICWWLCINISDFFFLFFLCFLHHPLSLSPHHTHPIKMVMTHIHTTAPSHRKENEKKKSFGLVHSTTDKPRLELSDS